MSNLAETLWIVALALVCYCAGVWRGMEARKMLKTNKCIDCKHKITGFMDRRCELTGTRIPLFTMPTDCPLNHPVCKQCHGKGYIEREADGREHEVTCKACKGSGEDEDGKDN